MSNRVIKFRGKSLRDGSWVYGAPIQTHVGTYIVTEENPHICSEYGYMEIDEFSKVQPETVSQFTGMLDRNGKEIYEGDILKGRTNKWRLESKPAPHDFIGYVRWEEQCDVGLQWVLTTLDSIGSSPLNWYAHCVAIDYSTGVIVGNIHDNPDMLKGGEA